MTPVPEVLRGLALTWGIEAHLVEAVESTDEMIGQVDAELLGLNGFTSGDIVVIVAGSPTQTVGSTNFIRVHRIGDSRR